jgi:hypothetical protein
LRERKIGVFRPKAALFSSAARALLLPAGMMGKRWGEWIGRGGGGLLFGLVAFGAVGCAHLHQEELSDIDSSQGALQPFDIKVSGTGFSVSDGAEVASMMATDQRAKDNIKTMRDIIEMTQMGPKTGDPTFNDDWADAVALKLLERCPTGRITGLNVRRETMDYPVISGEIVTVKGYCIL